VWNRNNAAALGRVSLCREIIDQFETLDKQEKKSEE